MYSCCAGYTQCKWYKILSHTYHDILYIAHGDTGIHCTSINDLCTVNSSHTGMSLWPLGLGPFSPSFPIPSHNKVIL